MNTRRIYVASSWRNAYQPDVVQVSLVGLLDELRTTPLAEAVR